MRSFQLRGASDERSMIKLSPSYPKSGIACILIIYCSMCISSSKRRASLAMGILEFRTFITPFDYGETSSIVLSSLPILINFWASSALCSSSSSSSIYASLPLGDQISVSVSASCYSAISPSNSVPPSAVFNVISFFRASARAFFFSFCFAI